MGAPLSTARASTTHPIWRQVDASGIPLLAARLIFGGMFIYMGVAKLGYPIGFLKLIHQYQMSLPPLVLNSTAIVLPWMEVFTGVALILGIFVRGAAAIIAVMLAVFSPVVLMRALKIAAETGQSFFDIQFDCGCGGGEVVICPKLLAHAGLFGLALVALFTGSRKWCAEMWLARRNPESPYCHLCAYYAWERTAGLCEKCARPPELPIRCVCLDRRGDLRRSRLSGTEIP